MAHAIGLVIACAALLSGGACATAPRGTLEGVPAEVFYAPGPFEARNGEADAAGEVQRLVHVSVSPERGNTWTVRFEPALGGKATTIVLRRLPDGRPATALLADAERGETVVFDPPLALTPPPRAEPPARESSSIALHEGLHPEGPEAGATPSRRGSATRDFLAIEPARWERDGSSRKAWRMRHRLRLRLGPATVTRDFQSLAVAGLGIVDERERGAVTVLGVPMGRTSTRTVLVEVLRPRPPGSGGPAKEGSEP